MPETKVDLFDPERNKKLSFYAAYNVLDSLLAMCLHSSQKTVFMSSNCRFLRICQESVGKARLNGSNGQMLEAISKSRAVGIQTFVNRNVQ